MTSPIKVLIVDDSLTIRSLIRKAISRDKRLILCGEAKDPLEARDLIIKTSPDVITLDIEMPKMNGLQFLDKIMRLRPTPVIMVSSFNQKYSDVIVTSLRMGAFDYFPKPSTLQEGSFNDLVPLIIQASASSPVERPNLTTQQQDKKLTWSKEFELITIGASTGGVEAIEKVLSGFPANTPPIIICQHMPAHFTTSFASRLDKNLSNLSIAEARNGEILKRGNVRIAPGGMKHTIIKKQNNHFVTALIEGDPVNGHRPSVDVLFKSIAKCGRKEILGILLTGMGEDGALGLLEIRKANGYTIAQDKNSSIVYGMPRIANDLGAACRVVPLSLISQAAMQI